VAEMTGEIGEENQGKKKIEAKVMILHCEEL